MWCFNNTMMKYVQSNPNSLNLNHVTALPLSQAPILIKEFGAVSNIDFSPVTPHNFAVTAFTRVSWLCLHEHSLMNVDKNEK